MPQPARLTKLRIHEVSSVDRGAGKGVNVVLMKRDGDDIDWAKVQESIQKGKTIAFDIDPPAFDIEKALHVASTALNKAIGDIATDTKITDKPGAISKALADYNTHVAGLMAKAAEAQESEAMSTELQKKLDETTAALTTANATIAKLQMDGQIAALPEDQKAFVAKMSEDDKKKFMAKKPDERQADCDAAKRATQTTLPPEVAKRLEQADKNDEILKGLLAERRSEEFKKRAVAIGLTEADGELLQKAYGGDMDAQKKLDEKIAGLTEQVKKGVLFNEFGGKGPTTTGKAYDELMQKAVELRKTEAGKGLTEAQAFDKCFTDPANAEIVKRMKAEEAPRAA